MAQPPAYTRSKDFTENFDNETDHSALNAELDKAANSINDIRANLAILQADDGKLRPAVVTPDSIHDDLKKELVKDATDAVQNVIDSVASAADIAKISASSAAESARLAQDSADRAIDTAEEAVGYSLQALNRTSDIPKTVSEAITNEMAAQDIDGKIAITVREQIDATPVPGLTEQTIYSALGYHPYDGDNNPNNFVSMDEIPEQAQADWSATSGSAQILNKPNLAEVATSGKYGDLSEKPTLATVAGTGSFNDLIDKPNLSDLLPVGLIAMWSGSADAIPSGWVLCDGENNTPDLRNRFIIGAGSTYAVDATGGATSRTISSGVGATTLTTSQIPSHTHTYVAKAAMHRYGTTSNDNHIYAPANTTATNTGATGGGGSHTHSFSAAVSILPPYYALCFIMKC